MELEKRLPAVLSGAARPVDTAEMLELANPAYETRRYATSARLYDEAIKGNRELAGESQTKQRYNAACAAALAASGSGKDEALPDEVARVWLRKQALDWLNAELVAWSKLVQSGPAKGRPLIVQTLQHWKVDSDLAGVRDPDALARLAESERKDWQVLWGGEAQGDIVN